MPNDLLVLHSVALVGCILHSIENYLFEELFVLLGVFFFPSLFHMEIIHFFVTGS